MENQKDGGKRGVLIPGNTEMGRDCLLLTELGWTGTKSVIHSFLKFQSRPRNLFTINNE